MDELPGAVFIVDPKKEAVATREVRKLGIPLVAIADSNCEPDDIDYIIPGNDDAIRAVRLFCSKIADACIEGHKRSGPDGGTSEFVEVDEDIPAAPAPEPTEEAPAEAAAAEEAPAEQAAEVVEAEAETAEAPAEEEAAPAEAEAEAAEEVEAEAAEPSIDEEDLAFDMDAEPAVDEVEEPAEDTAAETLRALLTIDGGEPIDMEDW